MIKHKPWEILNLMIDYRDLLLQGQTDIDRAKDLFIKEDYGFAAYSAQQGLEKYLKSFLMKFNIVKNSNIGHLPYSLLLEIIIDEFDDLSKNEKDDTVFFQYLQTCKEYFNSFKNTLDSFQKSDPKKILIWKSSLKMKLNGDEEKIEKGIKIEEEKTKSIMINGITKLFTSNTAEKPLIATPEDTQKLVEWLSRNFQSAQNNSKIDFSKEIDEIEEILSPYLYGVKEKSLSKQDSDFLTDFFKIFRTFEWLELLLASYPHEEIGRYPTTIDNESSVELYKERKDDLYNLITAIDSACLQIRTNILK
jgi:hypothetical protein